MTIERNGKIPKRRSVGTQIRINFFFTPTTQYRVVCPWHGLPIWGPYTWQQNTTNLHILTPLTLTLLTWRIRWAPNNASKWQVGFNLAFKGLISCCFQYNLHFGDIRFQKHFFITLRTDQPEQNRHILQSPYITNHIRQFRVHNTEELEISNIICPGTPLIVRNKGHYVEGNGGLSWQQIPPALNRFLISSKTPRNRSPRGQIRDSVLWGCLPSSIG